MLNSINWFQSSKSSQSNQANNFRTGFIKSWLTHRILNNKNLKSTQSKSKSKKLTKSIKIFNPIRLLRFKKPNSHPLIRKPSLIPFHLPQSPSSTPSHSTRFTFRPNQPNPHHHHQIHIQELYEILKLLIKHSHHSINSSSNISKSLSTLLQKLIIISVLNLILPDSNLQLNHLHQLKHSSRLDLQRLHPSHHSHLSDPRPSSNQTLSSLSLTSLLSHSKAKIGWYSHSESTLSTHHHQTLDCEISKDLQMLPLIDRGILFSNLPEIKRDLRLGSTDQTGSKHSQKHNLKELNKSTILTSNAVTESEGKDIQLRLKSSLLHPRDRHTNGFCEPVLDDPRTWNSDHMLEALWFMLNSI